MDINEVPFLCIFDISPSTSGWLHSHYIFMDQPFGIKLHQPQCGPYKTWCIWMIWIDEGRRWWGWTKNSFDSNGMMDGMRKHEVKTILRNLLNLTFNIRAYFQEINFTNIPSSPQFLEKFTQFTEKFPYQDSQNPLTIASRLFARTNPLSSYGSTSTFC